MLLKTKVQIRDFVEGYALKSIKEISINVKQINSIELEEENHDFHYIYLVRLSNGMEYLICEESYNKIIDYLGTIE